MSARTLTAGSTFIALLRGINVGGHRMVGMAELREFLSQLGFQEPRSLLQSGNLIFRGEKLEGSALERRLETEAASRLGLEAAFIVRSSEAWLGVIAENPFRDEARRDPGHLLVMFCKEVIDPTKLETLQAAITGRELVQAHGREAYIVYPEGVGRSRLTHGLFEKKLGTRATGRNWNTVLKLGALVSH
jgi:uncharacterized protein (DUF1697 family)